MVEPDHGGNAHRAEGWLKYIPFSKGHSKPQVHGQGSTMVLGEGNDTENNSRILVLGTDPLFPLIPTWSYRALHLETYTWLISHTWCLPWGVAYRVGWISGGLRCSWESLHAPLSSFLPASFKSVLHFPTSVLLRRGSEVTLPGTG